MNNRLRLLRAEKGWSQAELAGRIDVSRQAVNAIETGKHDPSLSLAFRIAREFGLPIEQVFDGGEVPSRTTSRSLRRQPLPRSAQAARWRRSATRSPGLAPPSRPR